MKFLTALGVYLLVVVFYSFIHDFLIMKIYCAWKKRHLNGYRCYYWTCKKWKTCEYNGSKRRYNFLKFFRKGRGQDEN